MDGAQIIGIGAVAFIALMTLVLSVFELDKERVRIWFIAGIVMAVLGATLGGLREDSFVGVLTFRDAVGIGRAYVLGCGIAIGMGLRMIYLSGREWMTRK